MFLIGINDSFLKEHWDLDYFIFFEAKSSFIAKSVRNLLKLHGFTIIQRWSLCYSDLPYTYLLCKKPVINLILSSILFVSMLLHFLAI